MPCTWDDIAEQRALFHERHGVELQLATSPTLAATAPLVFASSRFAFEAVLREPAVLDWLGGAADMHALRTPEALRADLVALLAPATAVAPENAASPAAPPDERSFMRELRRFRRHQLLRIAWRDLAGIGTVDEVLQELSAVAELCITAAVDHADAVLAARHGAPHYADGSPMPLLVLGMGKLGGGELNFSSDVDLIYLFPEHGETDGPRSLAHAEYFVRLGQRVSQLLGTVTEDGFVQRVDLRLRPFGESGPVAVSFDAFEDYLQQHGRDWERYAYVKARPIVGAAAYGELYRNVVRPFVYRRYLDFGVFEALREMKELIAREVARRELRQNVKLGPGGIREIEFVVQALQLIRGGADARLQTRSLLDALRLLDGRKLLSAEDVAMLGDAYRFLRRLENRLQQWNDEQTHELPADDTGRARLARAMGAADWPTLAAELEAHRARVSARFQSLVFAPAGAAPAAGSEAGELERVLTADGGAEARAIAAMQAAGVLEPLPVLERLTALRESAYYQRLDETGRRRLQKLLAPLIEAIAGREDEATALSRVLHVFESIGRRTVYLTLLCENAVALRRLVDLCAESQFLTEQIAAFPLLLDELIDTRLFEALPTRGELAGELRERMSGAIGEDPERQVELLRQFQRAAVFRVAVADLTGRLPLMQVSDRLTDIAALIVAAALDLAWAQITARHGVPAYGNGNGDGASEPGVAGITVIAYGKFGGIELGYSSDLDLVFLHDSPGEQQLTDGAQPIAHGVFFLRLVQRLLHLLTMHSAAGRLYEVDTRLRPSGKGGLLVQSLRGFGDYQRSEAWTWEHQALLRSRAVAGPAALCAAFERLRVELLQGAIHRDTLREEVRQMRERMRDELSQRDAEKFDLKRDAGGITDIEFLAQYWALAWAHRHAELVTYSDTIRILESLASIDLVPQSTVDVLTGAYREYRQRMHRLALDGAATVVPAAEYAELRERVGAIWLAAMGE